MSGDPDQADIVLIRPGFSRKTDRHWSSEPPLGIGYLASSARSRGIKVAVIDAKAEGHESPLATALRIREYRPQILGISAMTIEYRSAVDIAELIKEKNDKCVIIIGGAHANALSRKILQESPAFDFSFSGEADQFFTVENIDRVLSGKDTENIEGLCGRGGAARPGRAPAICSNLDDLPFPAWDLFPLNIKYPVMTERGCPHKCVFCSHNSFRRIRRRSIENVIEEIQWLNKDFRPKIINFEDETFGSNPLRTMRLLDWLTRFNKSAGIEFKAQTRVTSASSRMFKLMKKAGFRYVELGAESGDPEILENSGKQIKPEQVANAVRLAREAGLKVWLKFIIGLPGETKESVRRTIQFATKLNPDRMSVATIVAYPGSDIYRWAVNGENGYKMLTTDWGKFDKYLSNSLELENLSGRTMQRLQFQMYLEAYLRNRRFADLARLILKNRSFVKPLLRRLIHN